MNAGSGHRVHKSLLNTTLLVVGFGYTVDAFDTLLYNALRVPSLRDLGVNGDALVNVGLNIFNIQLAGMLIGGFLWGILGDKIGRKKALVGSVLLYSFGSLGCAVASSVALYALLRFLTGIGLAGEIALGAILVTETLPDKKRSWGLGIYALFAYAGIILAATLAGCLPWRTCYAIGGIAGLLLLLGRMTLFESGLYEKLLMQAKTKRGSLKMLLSKPVLLKRWLCCIFFMGSYFYVLSFLITLAPEFGKAVGVAAPIKASTAITVYSSCAMIGTMLSVLVSDFLRKRVVTLALFMLVNMILGACYLLQDHPSEVTFYTLCGVMGLMNYFVLLLFALVEQFGTNMRATAGTSAISIGRSTLVITNSVFLAFKASGIDILHAAGYTGAIVFTVGFVSLLGLRETYHQGMDFLEEA